MEYSLLLWGNGVEVSCWEHFCPLLLERGLRRERGKRNQRGKGRWIGYQRNDVLSVRGYFSNLMFLDPGSGEEDTFATTISTMTHPKDGMLGCRH